MVKTGFIVLILIAIVSLSYANTNAPYMDVKVYNPYSISAKVLVKCDYVKGKYKYKEIFVLNGNSHIQVKLPKNLNKCEIWPLDIKLFGKF